MIDRVTIYSPLAAILLTMLNVDTMVSPCQGGPVTTLEDISYWVGVGSQRAAIAIDWNGLLATDESLVWGYRWDGDATGLNMLREVVESDSRLLAKLMTSGSGSMGVGINGLGYDVSDDGLFLISDGTEFDATGIVEVEAWEDGATSVDPADLYAEGWFTVGFWHYGVAEGPPTTGGWNPTGSGASSRLLHDGSWDSWTFDLGFTMSAFAENLHSAEPSAINLAADFDADTDTDGDDFLAWQLGVGILTGAGIADGDADGDTDVDSDDLTIWRSEFESMAWRGAWMGAWMDTAPTERQGEVTTIPEPASLLLSSAGLIVILFYCARHEYSSSVLSAATH